MSYKKMNSVMHLYFSYIQNFRIKITLFKRVIKSFASPFSFIIVQPNASIRNIIFCENFTIKITLFKRVIRNFAPLFCFIIVQTRAPTPFQLLCLQCVCVAVYKCNGLQRSLLLSKSSFDTNILTGCIYSKLRSWKAKCAGWHSDSTLAFLPQTVRGHY